MDQANSKCPGASSDHLRAVADALPCMMFESDAQGANVWSNAAWQRYTGLTRAELEGYGWQRVLHPDDMAQDCAAWARAVESASEYRVRQRLRRFDGQWRWNLVSAAPLRDAVGNIQGWAGTITDIDDIVHGEASLLERARLARFGLQLNEELRDLTDARAMMEAAAAALGQYLGVAQVGFGEMDEAQDYITVHRDWSDGRIASVVGTWRLDHFGPAYVQDIKAGRTAAIADVTRDARTAALEVSAAYAAIGTRSILDVPLVRQGRLMALLFIHHPEPRIWTRAEIALVETVCARLWSAVERARAERSLAELTATLDLASVFVRDTKGVILHWSGGCERLYGWTAQEAVGRPAAQLLRTVFPVPRSEIQRVLERDGEWTGELRHTTRDGRELAIGVRKALRRDSQGRAVAVAEAVTDVTAAREAAAALETSNAVARIHAERLQLALDAGAIIGTWVWDLTTDKLTVDERFADTYGIDPVLGQTEISLEHVTASIHPDDVPGVMLAIKKAFGHGAGPYSHEYRVRGHDGVYHWVEANGRVEVAEDGKPLRFPGVLLSVERRRALETERDQALELLRAFADAVPGVVYAKDREGRMLVANRGICQALGMPPQAILGRTEMEFLDDKAQAAAVMANDCRIMESGMPEQLEETVSFPDGTPAVWLSTKAPFRDSEGRVIGVIGASLDITARKAAEARLAELNATLEQRVQQRTAELAAARDAAEAASRAKGEFLANMSHEIRTPLHGMLGMAQRLLDTPLSPQQHRQAQIVERSGRLLLGVIDDVLDFSRIESGRLELERLPFDLVQLGHDAVTLFGLPAQAKGLLLELSVQPPVQEAWVLGDALRLAQILNNLLSNAVKFTPSGSVELRLAARAGQRWRLSVRDSGIGLSQAGRGRIFEPFLQADGSITRRFGGTGLGLAIVRHLVQLHGGELGVDSEPGRGAEFWFELKLPPAQPPAAAPAAMNATPAESLQGHHVLVAEDNEVNMEVARAILQSLGMKSSHASNGRQAVQAFEAARPELVLMDVHMPELDGLAATRQIRVLEAERGWERTPIVALTASALHEDRQRCLDAGMDDVLVKPFGPQQLQRVLEQRMR